MKRVRKIVLWLPLGIALASGAVAGETTRDRQAKAVPDILLEKLTTIFEEQYVSSLVNFIRANGVDKQYLDEPSIDARVAGAVASLRANLIQQAMRADTDGDGKLSRAEMESTLQEQITRRQVNETDFAYDQRIQGVLDTRFGRDTDGDGSVSLEEAYSYADSQAHLRAEDRRSNELLRLLALDPNKDGKLTAAELSNLTQKAFRAFDKDHDGTLDPAEFRSVTDERGARNADRTAARRPPPQPPACVLPDLSRKAEIVLVSGYEGAALSSVSLAGSTHKTTTARLDIQPGKKPLYIYAAAHDPIVWQVAGATDRVEKFVAATTGPEGGAGVVGLPKSKIAFVSGKACPAYFHDLEASGATRSTELLGDLLGRKPSHVVAAYSLVTIDLPSASKPSDRKSAGDTIVVENSEPKSGPVIILSADGPQVPIQPGGPIIIYAGKKSHYTAEQEKLFNARAPDFVHFEASEVISSVEATPYDVVSGRTGLKQLMSEGKIRLLDDGTYLVEKPIARFPFNIIDRLTFRLAKNVPLPKEGPGPYCVLSEKTGKPVDGVTAPNCPE